MMLAQCHRRFFDVFFFHTHPNPAAVNLCMPYTTCCCIPTGKDSAHAESEEWRDTLRSALLQAGVERRRCVLYVTDSAASTSSDRMWEDVAVVMRTGWLPGVMSPEDVAAIVEAFRGVCSRCGMKPTAANAIQLVQSSSPRDEY